MSNHPSSRFPHYYRSYRSHPNRRRPDDENGNYEKRGGTEAVDLLRRQRSFFCVLRDEAKVKNQIVV